MRVRVLSTLLAVACFVMGANALADAIRLSAPVASDAHSETFGAPIPADAPVVPLAQILSEPFQFQDKEVLIEAQVGKVCQKKGCFFVAQDGAHAVRVAFKDYGFFVPTDIGGRRVVLSAQLTIKTLSAEQAEHLNADAGGEQVFRPGDVFELVASAVRVPKQG